MTILFDLPPGDSLGRRAAWYELVLYIHAGHGPRPELDVEINGRRGRYWLELVRGDRRRLIGPPSPVLGWATVRVPVARERLRPTGNRLVISTACDEQPGQAELRPMLPAWTERFAESGAFGSYLHWGGVEFRELRFTPGSEALGPTSRLTPTPFYVERDGELRELVEVIVDVPGGFTTHATGRVTIDIDGQPYTAALATQGRAFGQLRAVVSLPEFGSPTQARLTVDLDQVRISRPAVVRPTRKWTVHLIPHVHLDIGYTDYQAKVAEVHSRNIDRALAIMRGSPQYTFSVDGSYALQQYLGSRTPQAAKNVLDAVRSGRLGVNALYALMLTGIASLEEFYRAAYYYTALAREHQLPMRYANLTDVPTYPWSVPSMLAALGVPAVMVMGNHEHASIPVTDELNLVSPCRWEGPDGAQILAFFADHYAQLPFLSSDPPTVAGSMAALAALLAPYERDDYLPSDLPLVGTHMDNEDLTRTESDLVARWNERFAYPRLVYSTVGGYLETVRPLAGRLPVVQGDAGSTWEDGVTAHAKAVAAYRDAQAAMLTAEAASALVGVVSPTYRPVRCELDRGWEGLLIGCEHTWTSRHATQRPGSDHENDQTDWKEHQIHTAERVARDETRRALSQLGELITTHGPSFVLFNALSWQRHAEVQVELPVDSLLRDADGSQLPIEVIDRDADVSRVRLRTGPVPPLGYRTIRIEPRPPGAPPLPQPAPAVPLAVVRTNRYRATIDPASGHLTSLWHLDLEREILDRTGRWRLGEVLYVSGGGTADGRGRGREANKLFVDNAFLPEPDLTVAAATVLLHGARRTPWGWALTWHGSGPSLADVQYEVRLRDDTDRVDIVVTLTKEAILAKEAVYVAFPFAVSTPQLYYDRQQGWVNPAIDHQRDANNTYLATQHAVGLCGDDLCVTWSSANAPLFTVGDVLRGRWLREFKPERGTVLSWLMSNYWLVNHQARQDGRMSFRYAFVPSATWQPEHAARFGREVRAQPAVVDVTWLDKGDSGARPLPPHQGSLIETDLPANVIATILNPRLAERGVLVRLQETAGSAAHARLHHPAGAAGVAARCTAAEQVVEHLLVSPDGVVGIDLVPNTVVTIYLGPPPGTAREAVDPPSGSSGRQLFMGEHR